MEMAGKIYHPTKEQLARYAEEMQRWGDARLVNKEYYDLIDAEMATRPEPTLANAIHVMMREGNRSYMQTFPGMDTSKIEEPFAMTPSLSHEMTHIVARIGHTPQQEMVGLMFDIGFTQGTQGALRDPSAFRGHIVYGVESYHNTGQPYLLDKNEEIPRANARQQAIYLAAGMYLRQKIDAYNRFGLPDKTYALQKRFADAYAVHEPTQEEYGAPSLAFLTRPPQLLHEHSPYALCKLDDAEWKAIIAVTTGIKTPDQTAYAERLTPIVNALNAVGYDYNVTRWAERAVKNHAEHHPKGEAFDPEKFKAAREKRGADGKER